MATVMISNQLLRDVYYVISDLEHKEKKRPADEINKLVTTIAFGYTIDDAKRKLWGEHLHLAPPAIPENWCDTTGSVNYDMEFKFDAVGERRYRTSRDVDVRAMPGSTQDRLLCPPNSRRHIKLDDMRQHCTPEQFAQMEELYNEVSEISEKYKTLSNQVEGVLKAHPSLNKALFAYPELKRIVPKEYLDRVEEPTARAKREAKERPEAPQLDRDALLNSIAISNLINN